MWLGRCAGLLACLYVVSGVMRTCDTGHGYRSLYHTTEARCLEECIRRRRCTGVVYAREALYCELLDIFFNYYFRSVKEEVRPMCAMFNIWDVLANPGSLLSALGDCFQRPCNYNETCLPHATSNGYTCVTLECPKPKYHLNSKIVSNTYSVGSKNMYLCNSGYTVSGNPFIECLSNGSWTPSSFSCFKAPPLPDRYYASAVLLRIEYNHREVTTSAHFQCGEGYRANGEMFVSTWHKDGPWTPRNIQCIRNETLVNEDWRSFRVFGKGIAANKSEMSDYCKSEGGVLRNPISRHIEFSNNSANCRYLVWVTVKKGFQYSSTKYNLTICLQTELKYLGRLAGLSYDQLVMAVRDRNLANASTTQCRTVNEWLDGEPDGGDTQTCIFSEYNIGNKKFDQFCDNDTINSQTGFFCYYEFPILPTWKTDSASKP